MRAVGDRGAWRAAGAAGRRTGSGVGVVRKSRGSWQDPEEAGGTKSDRDDRMEDVGKDPSGGGMGEEKDLGGGERSCGTGALRAQDWMARARGVDGVGEGTEDLS